VSKTDRVLYRQMNLSGLLRQVLRDSLVRLQSLCLRFRVHCNYFLRPQFVGFEVDIPVSWRPAEPFFKRKLERSLIRDLLLEVSSKFPERPQEGLLRVSHSASF
jgi:hypothetical protein